MKSNVLRALALIMIAVMLLPAFAGCADEEKVNSDTEVTVSEEISEETEEIKGEPVENPEFATVVSNGATYASTATAGEEYPDSYGMELTDAQLAPAGSDDYKNESYVGYLGGPFTITMDLGEVYNKIYEFKMGYLSTNNAGIAPPAKVVVKISENGKRYTEAGTMTIPEYVEGARLEAVFRSEYYLSARFIRLEIFKMNSWIFIDEVSVISDEEKKLAADEQFRESIKAAYDKLGTVKFEGGITPDREIARELVSKGCDYTVSAEALKEFPDKNKYLTDGSITGLYDKGYWVGFAGGEAVSITVDLGQSRDDLSDFRLTCYSNIKMGRNMPVAVTYAVSDDNQSFTDVGRIYAVYSGQSIYDFPLNLDKCASGRYVRFTLEATESKSFVVEEAAVYAYTGYKAPEGSFFEPLVFDTEVKKFADVSDKSVNLIKGKTQQIFIPDHITPTSDNISAPNTPVLTDGRKANVNDIHNDQFFKFTSASAIIEIYYDLGDVAALKSFTAQFTHRTDWGVRSPYKVTVFLSDDARTWYNAGVANVDPTSNNCLVATTLTLKKAVQARYICFYMLSCEWIGIGELEAFGTTAVGSAPTLANSGLKTREESAIGYQEPSEKLLNGAKDLCLLYHGPRLDGFSAEKLLPYLAYVDAEGNVKDTMFDSFLFLNSGGFPSGRAASAGYEESDIDWVISDLFREGRNILALEEVAGQVKETLALDADFKYGLTIALYMPKSELTLEEKKKAVADQISRFEKKYKQYNFKNIELVGYYWFDEGVYHNDFEPTLVKEVSKMVHAKGVDFFWIPWFASSGVDAWQDHDFDVVCMQPGYVFDPEVKDSRLESAANMAKYYGMGIEIEIAGATFGNPQLYQRYIEYLAGGAKYGYMENCVHMYYQEIDCYYDAAMSSGAPRLIYDYTYQFIKGTLSINPDALETVSVTGAKNTIISGNVMTEVPEDYSFSIATMPENGTVSFGNDGSFAFYPEKDFTGTVSFTYTYKAGFGNSEPCTVEITVE